MIPFIKGGKEEKWGNKILEAVKEWRYLGKWIRNNNGRDDCIDQIKKRAMAVIKEEFGRKEI